MSPAINSRKRKRKLRTLSERTERGI